MSTRAMGDRAATLRITLEPLQVGAHVGCALVTQVAVFLQGFVDDVFKLGRQIWIQPNRRYGSTVEDRFEDERRRLTSEGENARHHFVQHYAEGKQVRARVEFFSLRLFGRHVGDRAQVEPGLVRCSSRATAVGAVTSGIADADRGSDFTLASPKSRIFACSRLVTKMLAGLMSR